MSKVILFPTHKNYCSECIYYNKEPAICLSEDYNNNMGKVIKLGYCPYKRCKNDTNK